MQHSIAQIYQEQRSCCTVCTCNTFFYYQNTILIKKILVVSTFSTREASGFEKVTRKLETTRPGPYPKGNLGENLVDFVTFFGSFWADFLTRFTSCIFYFANKFGPFWSPLGFQKGDLLTKMAGFLSKTSFASDIFGAFSPQILSSEQNI